MSTLIIAEAGVNHNGDIRLARKLVDVAAEAGADLVKFQSFKAESVATLSAPKSQYQAASGPDGETQRAMLQRLELSAGDHAELVEYCKSRGIGFFSTAFDVESLALLAELGLDRFKIPSGEITNLPYLRAVGSYGKPVILSTGMATMDEIADALRVLEESGVGRSTITVLHCNTQYPTAMEDVNLRAMVSIGERFGVRVGYSDHTLGIEVPIAAVAMGAVVIEKHFTLDRKLAGPDHKASLEPAELRAMVVAIRNVEKAAGDGLKRPTKSEESNRIVARRSLVAASPIKRGEPFTAQNLTAKRPGGGVSPMRLDEIIGRKAKRDYSADEAIEV